MTLLVDLVLLVVVELVGHGDPVVLLGVGVLGGHDRRLAEEDDSQEERQRRNQTCQKTAADLFIFRGFFSGWASRAK